MVTLIVNYLNLISASDRIKEIGKNTGNRRLNISMTESEGDFAEQMIHMAERIYECGQAFSELAVKTGVVLDEARMSFMQADESAAGQFGG